MWEAKRPSNIALIKYMGKTDTEKNKPTNSSISWTLDHLLTTVTIEENSSGEDLWQPLESQYPFVMSETGRKKYLGHLDRIKKYYGVKSSFTIRSANNFPADCGIASSASSFAALTEAACTAFSELTGKEVSTFEKANLSALGSGSSCRSFLSGWVLWNGNEIQGVDSELKNINHMVVIVGDQAKKVSSSQAHKIVSSSSLFEGRVERAEKRLEDFISNSQNLNWQKLYEISWAEFWDMHALFETSVPSFGYFQPGTVSVLQFVRNHWELKGDGPIVTMDAGPNIHLLWREDQADEAVAFFTNHLKDWWTCLSNIEGIGFAQV